MCQNIHQKLKTTTCNYLHEMSDHPRHVQEGIANGQFRRLRRICSNDEDYWKYGKQVEEKLVSRGYGKNQVRQQMKETFQRERGQALKRVEKRADKRVNFVITHSGYLPNINKILIVAKALHGQRYPLPLCWCM